VAATPVGGPISDVIIESSAQLQLEGLASQIQELRALNGSFKAYLETIVTKVAPKASEELIESEQNRIREITQYRKFIAHAILAQSLPTF
jgi:hypothetical protein